MREDYLLLGLHSIFFAQVNPVPVTLIPQWKRRLDFRGVSICKLWKFKFSLRRQPLP